MKKAYRFRLYPTKDQEILIHKTFGCVRYVYNHYLNIKIALYNSRQANMSYKDCSADLTMLKKQLPWLNEVDSTALQGSLRNLFYAYQRFFDNYKNDRKNELSDNTYGFPAFKSKTMDKKSYQTRAVKNIKIDYDNNLITLPKIKNIPCVLTQRLEGRMINATVSQTRSKKYYISILCNIEDDNTMPESETGQVFSVDPDIELNTIAEENADIIKNINNEYKQIEKLRKQLKRSRSDSIRSSKIRCKISKKYERINNQKTDLLQKATSDIVRNNDIIYVATDLSTLQQQNDKSLSKKDFIRMLQYKTAWYNKRYISIEY